MPNFYNSQDDRDTPTQSDVNDMYDKDHANLLKQNKIRVLKEKKQNKNLWSHKDEIERRAKFNAVRNPNQ